MLPLPPVPALIETQVPPSLGALLAKARAARDGGRLLEAIEHYDAMLAQVPEHETALLERAETLGWAGRYGEASSGYLAFRQRFPAQAFTADLALARLAAWQGQTARALALLDPWLRQEKRQALLDAAVYLSWSGRLPESLAMVRRWRLAHPEDREALLIEARVHAWAGQNAEARALYRTILTHSPQDREALAGLARLALWEGNTPETRRILATMSTEALAQADSQLLLAQAEAAEGLHRSALVRTEALARGGPAQKEARDLRDDLIAQRGPWVEVAMDRTDTSEGLRTENPGVRARLPLGEGALNLGLASRRSDFQGALRHPSEASLGLSYPLGPRLSASGTLNRLSEVGGSSTTGYALGLGYRPLPGLDLSLSHERSLALFTPQAVPLRTVFLSTDLGTSWRFGQGRHALSGGLGHTEVASGPQGTSTRRSHLASYEYRFPTAILDLRGGLLIRGFGYSQTLPLGFFNPERYRWRGLFGSAAWHRGRALELALGAQAGHQQVNDGRAQFTWSYRAGATWRPSKLPLDLSAWWAQSLAGLPVTNPIDPSAYREHTLGFSLRMHGR